MLPLRDINPTRRFPFVNYALIIINVLVFLWELSFSADQLNSAWPAWPWFRQVPLLTLSP